MDLDLDALELRAKAATPGPWGRVKKGPQKNLAQVWVGENNQDHFVCECGGDLENPDKSAEDAAHIAGLDPQTVLALVARAREAGRLEEEIERLTEDKFDLRSTIERSAGNAAHWQREKQTILDREKGFSARATAAETEAARLRTVVEKLRAGICEALPFTGLSSATAHSNLARLLAQTAPDVPADQDGRAGE